MLLYIGKALLLREKALNATLTQHLYIFFGTATLIGFSAGFILYLTSNYLDELLYLVPARSEDRQLGRRKRMKSTFLPALDRWPNSRGEMQTAWDRITIMAHSSRPDLFPA